MSNVIATIACFIIGIGILALIGTLPDYLIPSKTIFVIFSLLVMGIGLAFAFKE